MCLIFLPVRITIPSNAVLTAHRKYRKTRSESSEYRSRSLPLSPPHQTGPSCRKDRFRFHAYRSPRTCRSFSASLFPLPQWLLRFSFRFCGLSLPQKQVLKLSTSVSIKSCNNKDNNNKIFYISKNQKIDYKKVKKIHFLNQDLTQIPNINPSIKNSFSNKSHKFILCPKKLILKNSNNTLSYREKVKKLRSFANLNSSNSSLFDKKKKKTMSMDSYELEKSKFKKLLFDENICISKKKVNL